MSNTKPVPKVGDRVRVVIEGDVYSTEDKLRRDFSIGSGDGYYITFRREAPAVVSIEVLKVHPAVVGDSLSTEEVIRRMPLGGVAVGFKNPMAAGPADNVIRREGEDRWAMFYNHDDPYSSDELRQFYGDTTWAVVYLP